MVAAEFFIDTVGANGSGFPLISSDGNFDGASETGFGDIPLGTVRRLTNGAHTIYVHGKNAAGNWGATGSAALIVDKIRRPCQHQPAAADPTTAASGHFLVTFSEPVTGVTSANFALAGGGRRVRCDDHRSLRRPAADAWTVTHQPAPVVAARSGSTWPLRLA